MTPSTDTSALIFAATAWLLGGVSLSGGIGSVPGVAAGVITLALLQELLVVLAVSDYVNSLITGGLLVLVALFSAPDLVRRWRAVAARRRSSALAASAPVPESTQRGARKPLQRTTIGVR